jgi:glycine/serine hydroxymethyltransferase
VREGHRQGGLSGLQGGPLVHIIAAKAVLQGSGGTGVADYQQIVANAKRLQRCRLQASSRQRRHRQPPDARRRIRRVLWQVAESALASGITNKNATFDRSPPMVASGVRTSTPLSLRAE